MSMEDIFDIYSLSDDELKKAFGKTLKELRTKEQLTQRELSQKVKIPVQSISVYERGEICPTIIQAMRISRFFELSIDDFILLGLGYKEYTTEELSKRTVDVLANKIINKK